MFRRLLPLPVLLVVLSAGSACTVVEPGNVGVQTFMGTLKDRVLEPGLSFPNFNKVVHISTQSQNYEVSFSSDDPRAAVSSDMQTVGFGLDMNYFVPSGEAARTLVLFVSRDPNAWERIIIAPTIDQAVKSVFARHTLRELIETREAVRMEVAEAIGILINERLRERDPSLEGSIRVAQVTLTNLDYSREFEAVIEETQREEQRVRLARNELERIRIENERQVVEAEAQRLAAVERARGVAEAMHIEVEAQAEAYRLLREAGVDVNLFRVTEKWDGRLPQVSGSDNVLMNLGGLQ
ncbi:MAG: hypothetical protein EA398_01840 [Deltaproteobacteria bacterium]|nr:MAG: hypothetical protein EA398_01840 [Deltaproteobacteria bacterium]